MTSHPSLFVEFVKFWKEGNNNNNSLNTWIIIILELWKKYASKACWTIVYNINSQLYSTYLEKM
jgi:hypothetical protein